MSDIPPRRLFPNEGDAQASAPAPGASYQLNSPPLIGQAEFIQADIACSQCGYNLRGQARDGRCSECGTPVMDAFRRGMLIYSDRNWLIRVRSGMNLVFWGIAASIIFMCICMIFGAWFVARHGPHFNPATTPAVPSWIQIPSAFLGLAGILYLLAIVVRLTAPEPQAGDAAPPKRTGRPRTIVRLAWGMVIFHIVSMPIAWLLGLDPANPASLTTAKIVYTVAVGVASNIIYMTGYILLMLHLRSIARRDASLALGRLFSWVTWGGVSSIAIVVVGGVSMMLMSGGMFQTGPFATTSPTTQLGGTTVIVNLSTSAPVHSPGAALTSAPTSAPASAPVRRYTGPSPALFMLIMPVLAAGDCFGFVVFILGIVAAVQFYRALSRAITHNVGMATAFVVNPPMRADSKPPG